MVRFGVGGALRTFLLGDQRLPIRDRNLIIIGMNFAEGEETMAIAAIVDKGGLQRRLNAGDFGQVDVTAQLPAAGLLEVELLHTLATQNDHPGLLRMGGVYKHLVGH